MNGQQNFPHKLGRFVEFSSRASPPRALSDTFKKWPCTIAFYYRVKSKGNAYNIACSKVGWIIWHLVHTCMDSSKQFTVILTSVHCILQSWIGWQSTGACHSTTILIWQRSEPHFASYLLSLIIVLNLTLNMSTEKMKDSYSNTSLNIYICNTYGGGHFVLYGCGDFMHGVQYTHNGNAIVHKLFVTHSRITLASL